MSLFGIFGGKKDKETKNVPEHDANWVSRLKEGLSKSSSKINEGLKNILVRRKLDDDMLEELEDMLITTDIGVMAATSIITNLSRNKFDKEVTEDEIKQYLACEIEKILNPYTKPLTIDTSHKPYVIFVCGVNGSGKTTTIGKYAKNFISNGHTVMIAACDTFRAAAVDQLEIWAKRAGCAIVKGKENADPASVAYDAIDKAKKSNIDVLIIDTAGRLQNKKNLMEQLKKIVNVIRKVDESYPNDSVIVLDATTGQNSNNQVKIFKEAVDLTGIIVTKLDGTAKGGVVVSLAQEFHLPVHAIGVGEAIEDLRAFNAKEFAESMVGL